MNTLVIGCRTTEKELLEARKRTGRTYDLVWIDAGLHNVKKKLNQTLDDLIEKASDYDTILLATGFCGNSVLNLNSHHATLVLPRVDDCTSLLIGSVQEKAQHLGSYFLTEGWLNGKQNIWNEYQRAVSLYGSKRADSIFQMMFANYKKFSLIDTGCYSLDQTREQIKPIAETFHLALDTLPGTLSYLEELLVGSWDPARFLIVPPGHCITSQDLQLFS